MGYNIPSGYSRVTVELGAASSLGSQIVFGFGVSLNPSEGLLDEVEAWVGEEYILRLSDQYSVQRIEARNNTSMLERSMSLQGDLPFDCAPPNVAALVRIGTGLIGRNHRGRIFLPGVLDEANVASDGSMQPTLRDSLQAMIDNLAVHIAALSGQIVILHSGVEAPTPATSSQVQAIVATQRRRLRR